MRKAFKNYTVLDEEYLGDGLTLDIYMPDFNLAIELQGAQHKEFSPFFHKNAEGFEDHKRRDHIKANLCEKKGITLVVFWYYEPLEDEVFVQNKIMDRIIND